MLLATVTSAVMVAFIHSAAPTLVPVASTVLCATMTCSPAEPSFIPALDALLPFTLISLLAMITGASGVPVSLRGLMAIAPPGVARSKMLPSMTMLSGCASRSCPSKPWKPLAVDTVFSMRLRRILAPSSSIA